MGRYTKFIGGALGWALGGPIGGILGYAFASMMSDDSLSMEAVPNLAPGLAEAVPAKGRPAPVTSRPP